MSKYEPLWQWIKGKKEEDFQLTFDEIAEIGGVPVDHSFLKFKKELLEYGFEVKKISMKAQTVLFTKHVDIVSEEKV